MLKWAFNPDLRPVIAVPIISVETPTEESDDVSHKAKKTTKKRVARSHTGTFTGRLGVGSLFGSFSGRNDLALRR